jgi:ribosome-associated heat shock protein Hsp15
MSGVDEASGSGGQRLDRWLWFARIFKSRSLATKAVESSGARITRAGATVRTDKPSYTLRVGDVVTIEAHERVRVLEVQLGGVRRGPAAEAQTLYKDLSDPAAQTPKEDAAPRPPSRPNKRDRRALDRLKREIPDGED